MLRSGRPRKDGTTERGYKNPWEHVMPTEVADSVGGACANIARKTPDEIRHIRDWCNHLLKKKGGE